MAVYKNRGERIFFHENMWFIKDYQFMKTNKIIKLKKCNRQTWSKRLWKLFLGNSASSETKLQVAQKHYMTIIIRLFVSPVQHTPEQIVPWPQRSKM